MLQGFVAFDDIRKGNDDAKTQRILRDIQEFSELLAPKPGRQRGDVVVVDMDSFYSLNPVRKSS